MKGQTFMQSDVPGEGSYALDPESPAELARLINVHRFMTRGMGGPLVGVPDPSALQQVLDLACGPGGWVLDVAFACPDAQVAGVDISKGMVDYANARAYSQGLHNASFGVMNITQPLDFAENSFDLVNARFLFAVLYRDKWLPFLKECKRILRPGGIIRLTEPVDLGETTSPALERLHGLIIQAMSRAGYGFSPDARTLGITPMLPRLLRDAGYQRLTHLSHTVDVSQESEAWSDYYHSVEVATQLIRPLLNKIGNATPAEVEQLCQQTLIEMNGADFCGLWHYFSVVGYKPE